MLTYVALDYTRIILPVYRENILEQWLAGHELTRHWHYQIVHSGHNRQCVVQFIVRPTGDENNYSMQIATLLALTFAGRL